MLKRFRLVEKSCKFEVHVDACPYFPRTNGATPLRQVRIASSTGAQPNHNIQEVSVVRLVFFIAISIKDICTLRKQGEKIHALYFLTKPKVRTSSAWLQFENQTANSLSPPEPYTIRNSYDCCISHDMGLNVLAKVPDSSM